ncbi:Gfo/Idh/MocA family protein [Paenibacillus sp. FSL K6-2524]|uniref:Gfo/Idh/MocA family protein n=1 Tax=Paenibacillus sp. FSL K6-2524 TaxID=2954516 RepID=UPI0030F692AF
MSNQSSRKVKWGIMGTGVIAEQFVADLVHTTNGEAYAVGSRREGRAEEFAEKFNLPCAYGSYEDLVHDPEVDVIYIATPHPFHQENAMNSLRAGKAVLCEKPFTVNSNELESLISTAREQRLFLMEAMWMRFLPPIVRVRQWLEEGRIGEVRLVKAEFGIMSDWDPEGRLLNPDLAGGALLDVGIYPVSFASMIFGSSPEEIWSTAHIGTTGVDEQFSLILSYGSRRSAALHGAVRLNFKNETYIYGTKGYIYLPTLHNAASATLYVDGEEAETFSDDRAGKGYSYEAEEVGSCILAGLMESPMMPWDESLGVMRLLDEVREQWKLQYPFE